MCMGNRKGVSSWLVSETFSIVNGTRQGSVLSPILFSLYLDGPLKELRQEGVGCHVGGIWMGASGYADDLILLSPSRESMSKMIRICQEYGAKHNLIFSTDPNPAKSKTKCVYFCGLSGAAEYPAPLVLDGKCLPWHIDSKLAIVPEFYQIVGRQMCR